MARRGEDGPGGPAAVASSAGLLRALSDVSSFDAAAALVVEAAQAEVVAWLREDGRAADEDWIAARVSAVALWHRAESGLRVRRHVAGAVDPSPHLSGAVWDQVSRARGPVAILLFDGSFVLPTVGSTPIGVRGQAPVGDRTRRLWDAGGATHLLALPMSGRDAVDAVLVLELHLPALRCDHPRAWGELVERLTRRFELAVRQAVARPDPVVVDELAWAGAAMQPALRRLRAAARLTQPVLFTGPTGVGKTELARELHRRSPRAGGPFIVAPLGAIPAGLVSMQLFGAVPGAASGVIREMTGFVDAAAGGTLLLDDVHLVSHEGQAALLELLDQRTWRRLGAPGEVRTTDARFLATASVDMQGEVLAGRFRPDLLARLSIGTVDVPPLDRRRDELGHWARVFAERLRGDAVGIDEVTVAADFVAALACRPLAGNLRSVYADVAEAFGAALIEAPEPARELVLRARHLAPVGGQAPIVRAWEEAADRFIDAASGRGGTDRLCYEDAPMSALILARAAERLGVAQAIALLGTEKQAKDRNSARAVRLARERWASFAARLTERS